MIRQLLRHAARRFAVSFGLAGAILSAGVTPAAGQSVQPSQPTIRYGDNVGNGIAIGAALGAIGVSAEVGTRYDDPLWDGAVIGALAGAGAMAGLVTIGYARCDAGCEAPAEGPMYAAFMGFGAASGAGVGWLIDKLHKGKRPAPVAVALTADRRQRAIRVQWRF